MVQKTGPERVMVQKRDEGAATVDIDNAIVVTGRVGVASKSRSSRVPSNTTSYRVKLK